MTSTKEHATQVTADPAMPTIRIVREFDAPRERVFRAYTERDLVAQWMGPRTATMDITTWDCRTGGSYRYSSVYEGVAYGFYGSFHEVRQDERLVQTFTHTGDPDGVWLETATFEDIDDDSRTRLTVFSVVESLEIRDGILASGMETGVVEGFEKLDEILENL